ncbi:MAG: D-aminoacylase [Cyclobacteriaceae bacterium]
MKAKALLLIPFLIIMGCQTEPSYDILITGGQMIDGQGTTPFIASIAIKHDSIVLITDMAIDPQLGRKHIDVSGYVISPGFIDPHTHATADLNDTVRNANLNYLKQGVTTVFVGNDGRSALDIDQQFETWEQQGIGTNAATYIGHGTVRSKVMGMRNESPTPEEINEMTQLVKQGMEAGALGLSSGLYYPPASYSSTAEVIKLAKVAAQYNGHYDTHMRDESSYNIGLIGAVEETIEIAQAANIHGHIAHIKCLGVDVWHQSDDVIQVVEEAQQAGLLITADQYPYNASGTGISSALFPRWFLADGQTRFDNPMIMNKLETDIQENIRKRGGADRLLLTHAKGENEQYIGLNLAQVASQLGQHEVAAAITLFKNGGAGVGSFNMIEDDIINFMKQPWVMTGSDGSSGHPRKYGSFPKKMREYVMEKNVLALEEMVNRSTSLPAKTFGLKKRGVLTVGAFADIIVFKPTEVTDKATFENPTALAEGMHYVIVNGQIVIDQGNYTGALAGRGLKNNN